MQDTPLVYREIVELGLAWRPTVAHADCGDQLCDLDVDSDHDTEPSPTNDSRYVLCEEAFGDGDEYGPCLWRPSRIALPAGGERDQSIFVLDPYAGRGLSRNSRIAEAVSRELNRKK